MSVHVGDTSGTPSMIGGRVASLLTHVTSMPKGKRAQWYRDLADMLLVAASKWDADHAPGSAGVPCRRAERIFPAQTSDGPAARMAYLLAEADALIVLRRDADARMAALVAEAWALCAETERSAT